MKKYFPHLTAMLFLFLVACGDSNEVEEVVAPIENGPEVVEPNPNADINNFIWNGMNQIYLWQGNVPDLADDRFASEEEYDAYLQVSDAPEFFFNSLIYDSR